MLVEFNRLPGVIAALLRGAGVDVLDLLAIDWNVWIHLQNVLPEPKEVFQAVEQVG